jgi:3-dehydro-L-gulonate 2-dehydrogenase
MRLDYGTVQKTLGEKLVKHGLPAEKAALSSRLIAQTSLDGVYSHGVNRFPALIENIRRGFVLPLAEPSLGSSFGAWERWDGGLGLGNLNAHFCMDRAVALARANGLGCVALANTNHWLRGGTYGLQAADSGCVGICWTNTQPNMPAWGGVDQVLGNNPLVMAVPGPEGAHILLDMAISQYSYGKMSLYASRGEELPVAGGYGADGALTTDPQAIIDSGRTLPIGFWKGSGLSLLLDVCATLLSGGLSVSQIPGRGAESGLSQVFLAFDLSKIPDQGSIARSLAGIIAFLKSSKGPGEVRYPGEGMAMARRENAEKGIPVDEAVWETVLGL